MRASVFIATSLDGFIARTNGGLDWLPAGRGEEHGYTAFMATVDTIVMGRLTYETVLTFRPWPYQKPVVVLTSRSLVVPPALAATVETMAGEPSALLSRLTERGVQHVYVDGGKTIQRFLEAGLIQRLIVTRIPVLLGEGIPLFGPLSRDVRLRHIATSQFSSGLVQSEYLVGA